METEPTGDEQWFWDLGRGIAVRASERGPGTRTMGPYASRADAEQWRERVEERNTAWEDDDQEWEGAGADNATDSTDSEHERPRRAPGPDDRGPGFTA